MTDFYNENVVNVISITWRYHQLSLLPIHMHENLCHFRTGCHRFFESGAIDFWKLKQVSVIAKQLNPGISSTSVWTKTNRLIGFYEVDLMGNDFNLPEFWSSWPFFRRLKTQKLVFVHSEVEENPGFNLIAVRLIRSEIDQK